MTIHDSLSIYKVHKFEEKTNALLIMVHFIKLELFFPI
jgi:hypothetical protein